MSEHYLADYCITGHHPVREATGTDLEAPAWLVRIPCGFEALTVTVYGDKLCADDAEEAAEEWIRQTNPGWATEEQWEALRETRQCERLPDNRIRYLVCRATGDKAEQAQWFVLRVDLKLRKMVRLLKKHVRAVQYHSGPGATLTHRGKVRFDVLSYFFEPYEDVEKFPKAWHNWIDAYAEEGPEWLPDTIEPVTFVEAGTVFRSECHGISVWVMEHAGDSVRLTCYAKDYQGAIESADNIDHFLK